MNRVCAVIVTYFPSADLPGNVQALVPQVDEVVLVDNATEGAARAFLEQALQASPKVRLLAQAENLGIAAALNIGARHASEQGYTWLATFDQDSRVSEGYIGTLLEGAKLHPQPEQIALLAPRYVNALWTRAKSMNYAAAPTTPYLPILSTWTSGNLLNLEIWAKIGGFREEYFIDYVDHDYCLRCGRAGYAVLEIPQARLEHRLGSPTTHQLGGLRFLVTHHSPLRRYYKARNALLLYKENLLHYPYFVLRNAASYAWETLKMLLWEQRRLEKLAMMAAGFADALRGRMGRYG